MSGTTKTACINKEGHELHLCELKRKGLSAEIAVRTDDPEYLCHNCNATANQLEDLCNPSPLIKR